MHIKICGFTTLADAEAALEAGADLLGFNFYPKSPRYVRPEACAQMLAQLRPHLAAVTTVGIFVNETPEHVQAVLHTCGLDLAQLHGDEPPEMVQALGGRAYKAFRGVPPAVETYAAAGPGVPALLIDAAISQAYGGTGQVADWPAASALAARYPLLLAGGLTPENVARAVAEVRPWGVDVASGVESAPGRKDAQKMKAFVAAVRAVSHDCVKEPVCRVCLTSSVPMADSSSRRP